MRRLSVALGVLSGCSFTPGTFTAGDGRNPDTRSDDSSAVAGWSEPQLIAELSDPDGADDPSLTSDLLEIYFGSHRAGSMGSIEEDIWMAKRGSVTEPFGPPINVTELNTVYVETTPKITPNGKAIFFASNRPGGTQIDIWASTRSSRSVTWGPPGKVAEIATPVGDYAAFANDELLHLMYCSGTMSDESLYTSDRANTLALWGSPVKVDELDELAINECDPMEPSELALYYSTNYLTSDGRYDIYRAARPTVGDPYGSRTAVDLVNMAGFNDRDPWVSADEQTMVFSSDRGNVNYELYITTR